MTNTTENQGCLAAIFPFLKKKQPESSIEFLPYRLRDDFLSPAELSFFRVLSPLLGAEYLLLTKVRLADGAAFEWSPLEPEAGDEVAFSASAMKSCVSA